MKIENFKEKLTARCEKEYNAQPKELTPEQLHCAVSGLVMEELSPAWEKSRAAHDKARKASYLSIIKFSSFFHKNTGGCKTSGMYTFK